MVFKLSQKYAEDKNQLVRKKANKFGHKIIWAEYENINLESDTIRSEREAILKVKCTIHSTESEEIIETTYHNYLRSRTGLACCGRMRVSVQLTNRRFSFETRQRMSIAATRNQALRPRAVDNRDSLKYDVWRKRSQELGNSICQICQFRPKRLVVHHLFSMNSFPSIMYNSLNSVTLDAFIHTLFHKIYGYRQSVTIDCFIHFLETLLRNPILLAQVYSGTQPRTNNQDKN